MPKQQLTTFKNGAKAKIVETKGTYKDTPANRKLGRVGEKYTRKMYRIVKGGGRVVEGNPEEDWNRRYDPYLQEASDKADEVTKPILDIVGKIPVIGDALSTIMEIGKPLGLAINKGIVESGYNPHRNSHYEVERRQTPLMEDITRLQAKYGKKMKWQDHMDELGEEVGVVANRGSGYDAINKKIDKWMKMKKK